MYQKKIIIVDLLIMVLSLAMYRVLPLYTQGFMPMLSISIFAGAVIPNKKLAIALPLLSMVLSDFIFVVWATHTGFSRPMNFSGLTMCYADAIAFYRDYGLVKGSAANFVLGDLIWSCLIFSAYFLVTKKVSATKTVVQYN